jgi:hypothetical protein
MLTLKDVVGRDGVCWRFIDADAPDTRPTVNSFTEPHCPAYASGTWDWWDLHEKLGEFYRKHQDKRVELLESLYKRPTPTLLKGTVEMYKAVPTKDVRAGQWYLGTYNSLNYANKIAEHLNDKTAKPNEYRRDFGPITDIGFAVVRVEVPTCTALAGVVVRSCVDPLDKLMKQRVDGMSGVMCFMNYEGAQRTESLVRTQHGFVSTNAEYPLNEGQCALAREMWPHALRIRFQVAAEKERYRVVCDNVDEMPNMVDG